MDSHCATSNQLSEPSVGQGASPTEIAGSSRVANAETVDAVSSPTEDKCRAYRRTVANIPDEDPAQLCFSFQLPGPLGLVWCSAGPDAENLMLKVDSVKAESSAAEKRIQPGLWLERVVYSEDGEHFELKVGGTIPLSALISTMNNFRPICLHFGRLHPPPPLLQHAATSESHVEPRTTIELDHESQPSVPAGWSVLWHQVYERWYYRHEEADITTWDAPNHGNDIVDAHVTESVPLPPVGWGLAWSDAHQRWFWWNIETEVVVLLGDRLPQVRGAAVVASAEQQINNIASTALAAAAAAAENGVPASVQVQARTQLARARAHAALQAAMDELRTT